MPTRRHVVPLLAASLLAALGACASTPPSHQAFVVFFDEWSATPPAEATAVLDRAAAAAKADARAPVSVIGFADPDGSPQANRTLSSQRADNVAEALTSRGVDPRRFVRTAQGATEPTLAMVESRRVEIRVGQ